jgi:hypothetical protein
MNVFTTPDANGQPVTIAAGVPFTTYFVIVADEQEAAWSGIPIGERAPFEVNHPWTALDAYSDADLARFCITKTVEADPVPTRWSVRKSTVVQRLIEAGKIAEAMQAIMSDAGSFGLWTAPDWPEVYNDDARVIAMLSAIGADPAVILAQDPTA